jgi:hypothetical protein
MRFLALLLLAACLPTFRYEPKPLTLPPRSDAERCYQAKRMGFASGSARWTYQTGTPTYGGTLVTTHHLEQGGITIYDGGEHISAVEAVDLLEDMELRATYRRELDRTAGSRRMYPFWRNLALGMALSGLAITTVALVKVIDDPTGGGTMPLVFLGSGVAVGSIIPTLFASQTYEDAVLHERMKQLFSVQSLYPRFRDAAFRRNQALAAACGHPETDLPGAE